MSIRQLPPSRSADKYILRYTSIEQQELKHLADKSYRALNAEIVIGLDTYINNRAHLDITHALASDYLEKITHIQIQPSESICLDNSSDAKQIIRMPDGLRSRIHELSKTKDISSREFIRTGLSWWINVNNGIDYALSVISIKNKKETVLPQRRNVLIFPSL